MSVTSLRLLIASAVAAACSANGAAAPPPREPGTPADPALRARESTEAQAAPVASATSGTAGLPRLTEDMARPYFAAGPAADGVRRLALRDWAGARRGFVAARDALADDAPAADRARLDLVIAVCDEQLGDHAAAAAGFARAAAALPVLADFAHYHAALGFFRAGRIDDAERHARAVAADSRHRAETDLLIGDILRVRGAHADMARHYEAYLRGRKRGPRLDEATFRLAQAYEALGRGVPDAVRTYRRIPVFAPLSSWAAQASDRVAALTAALPAAERARWTEWTTSERLERGMALFDAMRNRDAAAEFERVVAAADATPAQACRAAYHLGYAWWRERNRTKSAPLFDDAFERCRRAGNVDLQVKSAYMAGRSYDRLDRADDAIDRFRRVQGFDHSYADDARLREAEQYAEIGDTAKLAATLESIPADFPDGDMKVEAVWRRAWLAYKQKDYDGAVRWLRRQIELAPIETRWYAEGQAQYWLGRALGHLGRTDESIAAYEECVRLYPLTYYSLLALNRLREQHPDAFARTVEAIRRPAGDDAGRAPAFAFRPREVYGSPAFLRGVELLKLGLGIEASLEFARAGLDVPAGREPVTDPDAIDRIWAVAWLYDKAGRYDLSHWPTRWHVLDYKRHWPTGRWRARWLIAYPLAWSHLIEQAAAEHGYPWALQMAIMREESAFDPLRESWANAIGLTQMIFPTARRFAKGTGIAVTRENLQDPVKNIAIGSRFLAFLYRTFEGRPGLVVPSYNAGEGATWRWIYQRHSPDWSRDEFEEEIPGDQARNYTKRVLGSFFAYSYLYKDAIPVMDQEVPLRLVPPHKQKQFARRGL